MREAIQNLEASKIREVANAQDPRVTPTTPVVPLITRGLPTRPVAPEPAQVYICAGVIVPARMAETASKVSVSVRSWRAMSLLRSVFMTGVRG